MTSMFLIWLGIQNNSMFEMKNISVCTGHPVTVALVQYTLLPYKCNGCKAVNPALQYAMTGAC